MKIGPNKIESTTRLLIDIYYWTCSKQTGPGPLAASKKEYKLQCLDQTYKKHTSIDQVQNQQEITSTNLHNRHRRFGTKDGKPP